MMLNQRLKRFRIASGLTQQQVADVLNLDRSTYAYYEAGKTTPDIKSVNKLLKIFNITYYELVDEPDPTVELADGGLKEKDEDIEAMHIYELSKAEKQLVINYRMLSLKQQEDLLTSLKSGSGERRRRTRKTSSDDESAE